MSRSIVVAVGFLTWFTAAVWAQEQPAPLAEEQVGKASIQLIFGPPEVRSKVAKQLAARGDSDAIAVLVLASRYRGTDLAVLEALSALTGELVTSWKEAMEWQEAHPEIIAHDSFRTVKLAVFENIDPNFLQFLGDNRGRRENLDIRLEEITWGGVRVDGIPSLDNPPLISASDAAYLRDDDLVFGVEINGDARAYPLRIMGWHEMFNEVIGGVPVALAYCTLCGSGILYETQIEGRSAPLVFGSSGFLYRSNKLMFDRETDSLWNQFTGKPVSGPLRGSGIELKIRPVVITDWASWRQDHPESKVLDIQTGFRRDYGSGVVYADYFASPDLMFPALVADESQLNRKDYVFGIRMPGLSKAWPLTAFDGGKVINDTIGGQELVLIGDHQRRSVRAYARAGQQFAPGRSDLQLSAAGQDWRLTEDALIGPDGTQLARLPGHIAYWFAWDSYLGGQSELYSGD